MAVVRRRSRRTRRGCVLAAAARRAGRGAGARDRGRIARRRGQLLRPTTSSTCTRCCRSPSASSPSSCASPRRRRSSTSAGSPTPRRSARCPRASSAGRARHRPPRDRRDGAVGARRRVLGAARRGHRPRVLARRAGPDAPPRYIFRRGMRVRAKIAATRHDPARRRAGAQRVRLAGRRASPSPARTTAARCCSATTARAATRFVVGAQGSATSIKNRVRTNGPNFNIRKENVEQVLYAIRNGGFSGAIMPQNIVRRRRSQGGRATSSPSTPAARRSRRRKRRSRCRRNRHPRGCGACSTSSASGRTPRRCARRWRAATRSLRRVVGERAGRRRPVARPPRPPPRACAPSRRRAREEFGAAQARGEDAPSCARRCRS